MAAHSTVYRFSSADQPPLRTKASSRLEARWSRSGCLTCKKRRKKCDEQKPRCGNCTRLDRECEGYANLWQTPFEPSIKTFRQESLKPRRSKDSPASDQDDSKNQPSPLILYLLDGSAVSPEHQVMLDSESTADDSERDQKSPNDSTALVLASRSENPTNCHLTHHPFQPASSSDLFYLQYHAERGFKLMSNLETQHNPLKEVLIPRALSSPLLLSIICAMSAGHMANWPSPNQENLRNAELTYYGRTLSGVRKALAQITQQDVLDTASIDLLEELIVTLASFCKYEAVRGAVNSWRGHLEALQKLVTYRGGLASLDIEIADWLSGLVTYWQHMAKLTNPKLASGFILCDSIYDSPKVDIYLGCNEQLVKICSRISDLRFFGHSTTALVQEVSEINEILVRWSWEKQDFIIPPGISEMTFERLRVVAHHFHYAAFIFLHSIIDIIAQPNLSDLEDPHADFSSMVHSLVVFSKTEALQNLVSLLRTLPPDNHSEFSALTFPLFIAGCEYEERDQLALILDSLQTLELNFGILNTKRAQEFLVNLSRLRAKGNWKHWLHILEDVDWDLILV
ncbi:putative C6 transcription factor [Talaromyces proteolyticus]|uniref:C6 transcription factor n=1 Tax=Talaromyces proteolyticus TaxID=1131652 RepID=A0AAD4PYT7_9EURO|nr:putative C6 transcription factor [Talaromyces proteolyticus]KAH8698306.1 putative C6 transcription factor [Talaromyces proteolyticus]